MRLFEKHKNGAVIDMEGESEFVAKTLIEWRQYQDIKEGARRPIGFVREEERGDSGPSGAVSS